MMEEDWFDAAKIQQMFDNSYSEEAQNPVICIIIAFNAIICAKEDVSSIIFVPLPRNCSKITINKGDDGRVRRHRRQTVHRQPTLLIVNGHLQLARTAPCHPAARREHRRDNENHRQVKNLCFLHSIARELIFVSVIMRHEFSSFA